MLVGFFSWWFAWITELLLAEWMNARERAPGRIVAEFDQAQILLVAGTPEWREAAAFPGRRGQGCVL